MARVVETVAAELGDMLTWKKVVTKELMGATRYQELSRRLGRPAPVPSIFINGELKFASTPSTEELKDCLMKMTSGG